MDKLKLSVYFYIPNIIGYIRIILLIFTLITFNTSPIIALVALISSGLLDACDGFFARLLNQISRFGTMLDYAIDRISLTIGICILVMKIPQFCIIWVSLLCIDLFSHFCQLYVTVFTNSQNHKENKNLEFKLLNLYSNSRPVLFFTCLSHDIFLVSLFIYLHWKIQLILWLTLLCLPLTLFKTLIHILQIISAVHYCVILDKKTT